jgi:hypothetical protein
MLQNFISYISVLNTLKIDYDQDAAQEVQDKLWQVKYALVQFEFFASNYVTAERGITSDALDYYQRYLDASNELFNKGKFYVETYYYYSFRIYKLLTHKSRPLPHLHGFTCPGVIFARNHLIEHPEGESSKATCYSYTFNSDQGFLLRTSDSPMQKIQDKGSAHNHQEFRDNFIKTISDAISTTQGSA